MWRNCYDQGNLLQTSLNILPQTLENIVIFVQFPKRWNSGFLRDSVYFKTRKLFLEYLQQTGKNALEKITNFFLRWNESQLHKKHFLEIIIVLAKPTKINILEENVNFATFTVIFWHKTSKITVKSQHDFKRLMILMFANI